MSGEFGSVITIIIADMTYSYSAELFIFSYDLLQSGARLNRVSTYF
ncbi:hypothetical protein [Flavobacterium cellulosilyticum]|nr:hypothetical protein [Flavobacterium cellulosilyticum]